jgi:hypothetical protein
MFVRWPGKVAAGRDIDRIGSMIDIMPTLAEACNVPTPAGVKLDGQSLWPLLSGQLSPEQWPDRTLYFQYCAGTLPQRFKNAAARSQRWKLVDAKELYDLQSDPAEAHDVAAANPQVVADLRRQYDSWFDDVCSTRGFDFPRILIGTPHENPTVLNRREWELENDTTPGQKILRPGRPEVMGHWVVNVVNGGDYKVTVMLKDTQKAPGEVHFQIGDIHLIKQLTGSSRDGTWMTPSPGWPPRLVVEFPKVRIPAQEGHVKVWYAAPDHPAAGVANVYVRFLGGK